MADKCSKKAVKSAVRPSPKSEQAKLVTNCFLSLLWWLKNISLHAKVALHYRGLLTVYNVSKALGLIGAVLSQVFFQVSPRN